MIPPQVKRVGSEVEAEIDTFFVQWPSTHSCDVFSCGYDGRRGEDVTLWYKNFDVAVVVGVPVNTAQSEDGDE